MHPSFRRRSGMLRVDCQTHVFPPAYAELLTACDGYLKVHREGDDYGACYGGFQEFLLSTAAYDVEKKIRDMDTAGIDIGILSLRTFRGRNCCLRNSEYSERGSATTIRAEVCRAHPGRFHGLAALALQDVPSALDELRRAMQELDFRGAVLYSNVCGRPVDAPEFEPLYAMAERERIPACDPSHRAPVGRGFIERLPHDPDGRLHGGSIPGYAPPDSGRRSGETSGTDRCPASLRRRASLPDAADRGADGE
ncbi:MAG: amidohydrolase family protein [Marinilabiliales bacterium]|nr:amidohydrolase family protein [Marinilabiliales bacterium]